MDRQRSTQGIKERTDASDRQVSNPTNIVDVRIMRTETFATTNSLSFALTTNPDMCVRIVRELRAANIEIKRHLDEIKNTRISWDLASLIIAKRSQMNRFSLVKSDCYWANFDTDLFETLAIIDECHDSLCGKFAEHFRLSDLLNIITTLENVYERFERKIEQIEDVLR